MSKQNNALRADFAEVKKNAKKVAKIRTERKAMKYGLKFEDYEEDEYIDLHSLFEDDPNSDANEK